MLIKSTGILEFSPPDKTKKHLSQTSWKRVAMITTNDDLCEYYAWFIKRRFNLELNKPLRGSHITFINDRQSEVPYFDEALNIFDRKPITFFIDPEPRTNGEHWWLRVFCPEAESIREICGGKREPYYAFHLTIGYAVQLRLEHSRYIQNIIQRYQILQTDTRDLMSAHEIVEFQS